MRQSLGYSLLRTQPQSDSWGNSRSASAKRSSLYALIEAAVLTLVLISILEPVQASEHELLHLNSKSEVLAYYEEHSFYPILHVFYNRHFSNSKQFRTFKEEVLEEVQFQMQDYARVVLTDCEKEVIEGDLSEPGNSLVACREIKRLNENRLIVGYEPSSGFVRFGDLLMQNPSASRVYDHPSDVYTIEEVENFIYKMMPNFFKPIENSEQLHEFLNSARHVPKLLYLTNEEFEQFPLWTNQLSVAYFERFEIAFADDLTESITRELKHIISKQNMRQQSTTEISFKMPDLLVLEYDYEIKEYRVSSLTTESGESKENWTFNRAQQFLEPLALEKRRSDHVFHMIKMPPQSEILQAHSQAEIEKALDQSNGYVVIAELSVDQATGRIPEELIQYQKLYGQYYQYIYYENVSDSVSGLDIADGQPQEVELYLFDAKLKKKHDLSKGQIRYASLDLGDFESNSTFWLRRDAVVVGVREKYGYICTLTEKHLFRGLTQCFVLKEQAYLDYTGKLKIQEAEFGFINMLDRSSGKIIGKQVKSSAFLMAYNSLEYVTRVKVKDLVDDFLERPIKPVTDEDSLQQICPEPKKLCLFYFFSPDKIKRDNSAKEYLEMEAKNFMNDYKFFEVDLSCNQHLFQAIPQLEGKASNSMIVYHPRKNQYVYLKAKMTRNVIQKFLKTNIRGEHVINKGDHTVTKELPFKDFQAENPKEVKLQTCKGQTTAESRQSTTESFQAQSL